MSKYVLTTEYDFNFSLLALSAHVPDYKMCIEINHLLGINLSRDIPIELSTKKINAPLLFSCFTFQDEEEQTEYILLSNTSSNTVSSSAKAENLSLFKEERKDMKFLLMPELAQADFLLMIKADNHKELMYDIQYKLKTITFVLSVQNMNPETLSSKKNLII
ncbi:MAG: IPExxxVDY family protein [Bacteroidia bacterium]